MSPARLLAILLALAICALAAAPAALGQTGGGAGDQQYQDPFGSQTKTTPSKTRSKGNGLSSTPNLGSSSGTAGSSTTSTAPTTSAAPATGSAVLPRTGEDVWIVALAGVAMLLGGLGLRLRAADDRR